MPDRNGPGGAADRDWLLPQEEQEGLPRYMDTLRERSRLIAATTALTLLVAIVYVIFAPRSYEARADLLVTPVAPGEAALEGLGLIRESSDPTRAVETAAQLATTTEVARRVQEELGMGGRPEDLLEDVQAEPVAQSNIVAVTASDETASGARELADAFAEQAVANRTDQLRAQIEQILPGLRTQAEREASPTLQEQVGRLEQLQRGSDPTIRVETLAEVPASPASPRPLLSLVGGLFGGLVLGLAAAFAIQILDPKLRREEQLRRLYRLPVLARIPLESGKAVSATPLGPRGLSPLTAEAFRSLRSTIAARGGSGEGRTVLVTGSSASEGKTTTCLNLASALALAGRRVILIEADLRRPAIGEALGVRPERGVVNVLMENAALPDALVVPDEATPNLRALLADYEGGWISELFALPAAQEMLEHAKRSADFVIIDSPPLADVVDALPLARAVDDLLIVARLGVTRLGRLRELGELLAENDIAPIGFAVVGTPRPAGTEYGYHSAGGRSLIAESATAGSRRR